MGLFGPRKPKFEPVAQIVDAMASGWIADRPKIYKEVAGVLNDPEVSPLLFQAASEQFIRERQFFIDEIRKTKSSSDVEFALLEYSDAFMRDWLLVAIEALNNRITQQHQLTLDIFDALAVRNETKIASLQTKLKEMEANQPKKEQVEILDILQKVFQKDFKDLLDKHR